MIVVADALAWVYLGGVLLFAWTTSEGQKRNKMYSGFVTDLMFTICILCWPVMLMVGALASLKPKKHG